MDVVVPEVGESIHEAVISRWHKKNGETIAKDDILCELETDKISLELLAEATGVVTLAAKEGETVAIGQVIATIAGDAATEPPKEPVAPPAPNVPAPKPEPVPPKTAAPAEPKPVPPAPAAPKPAPATSAKTVITADDGRITRTPMTPIRKRIAERLLAASQQTAMLTTFNEADMSRVLDLRKRHQETFQKRHGVKLGLFSFFVKATIEALKQYPIVNARIDGDDIVSHHYYNIGIAVATERGLVVPVLKNADRMHFADIERAIAGYGAKANENRIEISDLTGGTFTISNGGVYGSMLSTPILNPPQSGVLGMHAIKDRPMVVEGKIEIRPVMYLALSYDHRIIDGKEAVSFLRTLKEYIEEPEEMLLEF